MTRRHVLPGSARGTARSTAALIAVACALGVAASAPVAAARPAAALSVGSTQSPLTGADPLLPADACADVIVYVVRGSGEAPNSGPGVAPYDPENPAAGYSDTWDAFDPIDPHTGGSSIDAGLGLDDDGDGKASVATGTPFLYDLVEKVHERVGGQMRLSWAPIRYPAVPVDVSSIPAGGLWLLHGYPNSVTSGIRELHRTLKRQWDLCGTRTQYVLAGYSQGADVVNSYLRGKIITGSSRFGTATSTEFLGPSTQIQGQIADVTLIADPNHDPTDPESYTHLDPHLAQRGGLTGFREGVPEPVASVTDSICLAGDAVCGRGTRIPDESGKTIHASGYLDKGKYPVACHLGDEEPADDVSATTCMADRIVWRLGLRNLVRDPPDEAASAPGTTGRDVAFFVDTTGSMSDDIDAALDFAYSQAGRITSLDGRVALVQYRDARDGVPAEIVTPFTSDMSEFQAGLGELYADGGDDEPEGLLHALMLGFDGLDWRYGASKAAVILTDASFHEPDRTGGETMPMVERRSLQIDPVNLFPVVDRVGRSQYDDLAARTSGEVILNGRGDTELALSRALDNIAERPVAVLTNATYYAAAGRDLYFDASGSSAVSGSIAEYRWDLDGDGFTDQVTSTPTLSHSYPSGYSGLMQVLVVDDQGRSANASASVLVGEEPQRGLLPRVPSATATSADASAAADHVDLAVSWTAGTEAPTRWIVSVDGDPVGVAPGARTSLRTAIPFQPDPWSVTVTPMDQDGNLGPVFAAAMDPLPERPAWYRRPVVWAAGAGAGLLGFALVAWVAFRRRPRLAPTTRQGSA